MSRILAFLFVLMAHAGVYGQAVLDVRSNDPDALVYLDSLALGTVADAPFAVPPGRFVIKAVQDRHQTWDRQVPEKAVSVDEGDTLTVALDFPARIRIETIPYGAEVLRAGTAERLGRTPFTVFAEQGETLSFRLVRDGFHAEDLTVEASELYQRIDVLLTSTNAGSVKEQEIVWSPPARRNRWLDYASAGLAVAAGATAVHFKFKADRIYDDYELTGDPVLRPQFRKYDIYSGVALGAMQIGVGVLAVRIILR